MTENTSENKPSIVDDFFSALFASNNNKEEKEIKTETVERPENIAQEQPSVEAETETEKIGVKRERVLDEFDEYSLLSKRKSKEASNPKNGNFRRQARNKRFTPAIDSPHILSKRGIDWSDVTPESRMLVRHLPSDIEKQDVMDYFSKYGEVVEVALKNNFGFVQFENPSACARAVEAENGQTFGGVDLDLEVCRRKPYFARDGGANEHIEPQNRRIPPKPRGNFTTRSHGNRHNDFHNQNDYDNNKQSWNHSSSNYSNNNYDYKSESYRGYNGRHVDESGRSSEYRPDYRNRAPNTKSYGNSNNRNGQPGNRTRYGHNKNDSRGSYVDSNRQRSPPSGRNSSPYVSESPLPHRDGKDVPMVQVIAWGNVHRNFINYIENAFRNQKISVASATLPYVSSSRDNTMKQMVVKQMVVEGVKALVMVRRDRDHDNDDKVNLQVFTPNEEGGGVRFDEYDGITVKEAVVIVSQQQQQQQQPQAQPNHHHQQPPQYQQQPPLQQSYSTISPSFPNLNGSAPAVPHSIAAPVQNLDVNTLSTLYNMLQSANQQTKQQVPVQPLSFQQPQQPMVNPVYQNQNEQKPSIEQLMATIMNGYGANNNNNSSPTLQQLQQLQYLQQQQQQQHSQQQAQHQQSQQQQQQQNSTSNITSPTSSSDNSLVTAPVVASPQSNNQQPSVASLLSTVANGNPLLSQLLAQVNLVPSSIPSAPASQSQQNQQSYPQMSNNQLSDILGKLHTYSNTTSAPSTTSVVPSATTAESWM